MTLPRQRPGSSRVMFASAHNGYETGPRPSPGYGVGVPTSRTATTRDIATGAANPPPARPVDYGQREPPYAISNPASAADMRLARLPATSARMPSLAIIGR